MRAKQQITMEAMIGMAMAVLFAVTVITLAVQAHAATGTLLSQLVSYANQSASAERALKATCLCS